MPVAAAKPRLARLPAGPAPWDLFLAVTAAALAVVGASVAQGLIAAQPLGVDFLPMWTAARFAASGRLAEAYDAHAITEAQRWLLGPIAGDRPFPYPPSALLLFAPLAALPYWPALIGWTAASAAGFAAAAARLARPVKPLEPSPVRSDRPDRDKKARFFEFERLLIAKPVPTLAGSALAVVLLLAPPAAVVTAVSGQVDFLLGAAVLAALAVLPRRALLAGVLIGAAAAVKPTLLIAAPFALAAGGHWRALAAALTAGAVAGLASLALFGTGPWFAWLAALPGFQAQVLTDPLLLKNVIAPTALGVRLGLAGPVLLAWRAAFALGALVLAALVFRRSADPALRGGVLFAAGLVASPYAMNYDAVLVLPAAVAALTAARGPAAQGRAAAGYGAAVAAGFPGFGALGLLASLGVMAAAALARPKGTAA
ncbi:MAG TPA: glycosyltransferase 87 family protein [Caulobacteraceae bacterium]|nr:glycosyltransferase 87 family protein [Caulobacteraceae bacterium]